MWVRLGGQVWGSEEKQLGGEALAKPKDTPPLLPSCGPWLAGGGGELIPGRVGGQGPSWAEPELRAPGRCRSPPQGTTAHVEEQGRGSVGFSPPLSQPQFPSLTKPRHKYPFPSPSRPKLLPTQQCSCLSSPSASETCGRRPHNRRGTWPVLKCWEVLAPGTSGSLLDTQPRP